MGSTLELADTLAGAPEDAAPRLLGAHLVSEIAGKPVRIRITEVEAYKGSEDPASHAFRGRTPRNDSMFQQPGTLYVYRSYGIHNCANMAAGPEGVGWGILIRGGEVLEGEGTVRMRRGRRDNLTNGPGKVCQALGIDISHNGIDLLDPGSDIRLQPGTPAEYVMATPRIGISKALERPWRFVEATSVSV
jgi:DNA-3-methyladenine glycosylase